MGSVRHNSERARIVATNELNEEEKGGECARNKERAGLLVRALASDVVIMRRVQICEQRRRLVRVGGREFV